MSLSLKDIYDLLIKEIGILTIPRKDKFEIRRLTSNRNTNQRDTNGTKIAAYKKANALFQSDVYSSGVPSSKDLVNNGVVKANGNNQDAALTMLGFLIVKNLEGEVKYIEKVIQTSIMYRFALDENFHDVDRREKTFTSDGFRSIDKTIHEKHEDHYLGKKKEIIDRLRQKIEEELSECIEKFSLIPCRLSLSELCAVYISICVSSLRVDATRYKDDIEEKQANLKKYIIELNDLKEVEALPSIIKQYYLRLWNECSMLRVRDNQDLRTEIEKYIYPYFTYNNAKKLSPVFFENEINNKRMIIAESGLGKSTYLDILTSVSIYRDIHANVDVNEKNKEKIKELEKCINLTYLIVPILIRAGDYHYKDYKENMCLGGLLDCIIGGPTDSTFDDWKKEISNLDDRHIVLLIDAIDEIDHTQRKNFLRELNNLAEMFRGIDLLVTCRPIDISFLERSRLFRGIEKWKLEPFDREQMKKFVEARMKADTRATNKDPDFLLDKIVENDYLKKLSINPYMLEKMLVYSYTTGDNTAYSTIKFLVENLIAKRWDRLFHEMKIKSEDFTKVLAGIAHKMACEQKTIIGKSALTGDFMEIARNADMTNIFPEEMSMEIVSKMNNAAGLLIYENEGYKFQYPIFGSYLSAKWIYDQMEKNRAQDANVLEDLIPSTINNELWVDVITILFTIICKTEPRNEFLSTNLFRKIMCAGMGTKDTKSKFLVHEIFDKLENCTFGVNKIVSDVTMKTCIEEFSKICKGEE